MLIRTTFANGVNPFSGLSAWVRRHRPEWDELPRRQRPKSSGPPPSGEPTVGAVIAQWMLERPHVTAAQITVGARISHGSAKNALNRMVRFGEVTRVGVTDGLLSGGRPKKVYYYTLTGTSKRYSTDYRPRALSDDQVAEVRIAYSRGKTQVELAKKYGCGESTIHDVLNKRRAYKERKNERTD